MQPQHHQQQPWSRDGGGGDSGDDGRPSSGYQHQSRPTTGNSGTGSSSGSWSSWVNPAAYMHSSGEPREKGAKRKMIASYLKAANEVRQSYTSGYFSDRTSRNVESVDADGGGGWTDTELIHNGKEEMILFPSYARWRPTKPGHGHTDGAGSGYTQHHPYGDDGDNNHHHQQHDVEAFHNDDSETQEQWQLPEFVEQKPVVDVDVRGWIYYPHRGALTRKQRLWMGMARQMCGLPSQGRGVTKEDQEADKEAEKVLALEGKDDSRPSSSEGVDPMGDPEPGMVKRLSWKAAAAVTGSNPAPTSYSVPLTGKELDTAHGFLKSRLAPFMARPTPHLPVTIFFYNSKTSQSRTVVTNEFGQFSIRAGLPFVPTHVRVLASEKLHETEEIKLLEPHGVSLISDIDDTIKHSAVSMGAREMFRNTFIRDLNTLVVPGVTELYNTLHLLEVPIHYVSNSPWQLYPLLSQYFSIAGLPKGSFHLKQYSGMLQGIFEPVAERKKVNLERILKDFPERQFILVGDSGEADLEVYSEIALANPGRIRAIFIRDITSKEDVGFFSENHTPSDGRRGGVSMDATDVDVEVKRPPMPPRPATTAAENQPRSSATGGGRGNNDYREPVGNLIDFSSSDEEGPEELKPMDGVSMYPTTGPTSRPGRQDSVSSVSSRSSQLKSPPPPLPKKPSELKGAKLISPRGTPEPPVSINLEAIGTADRPSSALGIGRSYDKPNNSGNTPPAKPPKPASLFDLAREASIQDDRDFKAPQPPPRRKANTWNEHQPSVVPSTLSMAIAPAMVAAAAPALHDQKKIEYVVPSPLAPPKPKPVNASTVLKTVAARNQSSQSVSRPTGAAHSHSYSGGGSSGWQTPPQSSAESEAYDPASGIEKKVWLWNQRWERARESMEAHGVMLRKWRKGTDVLEDAVSVVQSAMTEIENSKRS